MNLIKLTFGLLIVMITVIFSCKKDEDLDPDNNNIDFDGYITFYTKTTGDACGNISISLNESSIGTLTDTTAEDPACHTPSGPGILTIGVEVGSHNYSASDACNNIWSGTIIINKGDCKTKELSR